MKANRCIERDTIYAGVLNDAELQIDDFWVLDDAFQEGMSIRAMIYCVNDNDGSLNSIQLQMWKDDPRDKIDLRRFGKVRFDMHNSGGTCKKWTLDEGDSIKYIRAEFNDDEYKITKLYFMTRDKKRRIIGSGNGRNTYFNFDMFSPFIGFHGYQSRYTGDILTMGIYRDVCSIKPAYVPMGFEGMNEPTEDHIMGELQ